MPMIVSFEFDDFVTTCEATCESDTGHGCFGAGVGHAYLFDGGNPVDDFLSHLNFEEIRDTVGDSVFSGFMNGVGDWDRGVT